jgi:hypothetical protein
MATSAEILKAARARIADPKNWTQEHYARTDKGRPVGSNEAGAVCWCAIGALNAELGANASGEESAFKMLWNASGELFRMGPHMVNDDLGHSAVLKIYDRAIELAEGK